MPEPPRPKLLAINVAIPPRRFICFLLSCAVFVCWSFSYIGMLWPGSLLTSFENFSTREMIHLNTAGSIAWLALQTLWCELVCRQMFRCKPMLVIVLLPLIVLFVTVAQHPVVQNYVSGASLYDPHADNGIGIIPITGAFAWLILSCVYQLPARPHSTTAASFLDLTRQRDEQEAEENLLHQRACVSCGYKPGPSPRITTCPECGSDSFELEQDALAGSTVLRRTLSLLPMLLSFKARMIMYCIWWVVSLIQMQFANYMIGCADV